MMPIASAGSHEADARRNGCGRPWRALPLRCAAVEGFRFAADLRPRFNETDAQGVVHHGVHVIWFEMARIAYLARIEGGYRGLRETGVDVTTVEVNVRYRAPALFDDRYPALKAHSARCEALPPFREIVQVLDPPKN